MSDKPEIRVENLSQSFAVGQGAVSVLTDVSFTIREDTLTVLFGPSGSGKSTVLNIITGLQPPTKGKVIIDGNDIYNLDPDVLAHFRARSVGFVYQQNYWIGSLDVLENVSVPLYFLGYSRLRAARRARKALELVGMGRYAKHNPQLLSSGEQQRVAMARAMVGEPRFIVADEPTGSLDSTNGDKIIELLRYSQEELHRTVILVSHNMEYLPLADNLLHIQDGRVRQMTSSAIDKTTQEILTATKQRIEHLSQVKKRLGANV